MADSAKPVQIPSEVNVGDIELLPTTKSENNDGSGKSYDAEPKMIDQLTEMIQKVETGQCRKSRLFQID